MPHADMTHPRSPSNQQKISGVANHAVNILVVAHTLSPALSNTPSYLTLSQDLSLALTPVTVKVARLDGNDC